MDFLVPFIPASSLFRQDSKKLPLRFYSLVKSALSVSTEQAIFIKFIAAAVTGSCRFCISIAFFLIIHDFLTKNISNTKQDLEHTKLSHLEALKKSFNKKRKSL